MNPDEPLFDKDVTSDWAVSVWPSRPNQISVGYGHDGGYLTVDEALRLAHALLEAVKVAW